jgi:hypothetical protein
VQIASERCDDDDPAEVSLKDMIKCLKSVKPSAIKSILVDVPNVRKKESFIVAIYHFY